MDDILAKLTKIKKLAESGIDGEKKTAALMLQKILKKYNLTPDVLSDNRIKDCIFKYNNNSEKSLFIHCGMKYCGNNFKSYNSPHYPNASIMELTDFDYFCFNDYYNFHLDNYRKEVGKLQEELIIAYVNKHNLFADDTEAVAISHEEYKKHLWFQDMLEDTNYQKKLNSAS